MDLPLEALKMIAQAVPVEGEGSHNLRWTPENGFVLGVQWGGQWYDIRFDFDDKLEDIKEEITTLTGIPMPEQKKKEKKEGPPMDKEARSRYISKEWLHENFGKKEQPIRKEASTTPLLDGIKEAVLGGTSFLGSISNRQDAQRAALDSALGSGSTVPKKTKPTFLSRIANSSLFRRATEGE